MDLVHQYLHERMAKRAPVPDITTLDGVVVSVVYVTAAPTFTGVIGGYTTLTDDSSQSNTQDSNTAQASDQQTSQAAQTSNPGASFLQNSNTVSSPAVATGASTFITATAALTTSQPTLAATGASSSSANSSSSSSSGMSTGAKAGLAIGIIAIIGLIAALLLWFMGKKRREQESYGQADDEKTSFGAAAAAAAVPVSQHRHTASSITTPNAPRLSLRPVSRMMPEFMGNSSSNKNRLSNGNMLSTMAPSGPAPSAGRAFSPSPQPRPITPQRDDRGHPNNPFNDPQNPFADPEKSMSSANQRNGPPLSTPGMNSSMAAPVAAGLAAGVAGGAVAAAAMSRGPVTQKQEAPMHEQAPRAAPAPGPGPISAPAPIVAPGPGPDSAQSNVYRVLMDFKPSMDDELELLTGQLVRLLHEYDDGWGVVPRTCLAGKPSKPKPSHLAQYARGPGGGSGRNSPAMGRPMSPAGRPMSPSGRPMSPAGRPMSPAGRPMSPAGRPMSPAGRPMSPAGGPRGHMGPPPAGFNGVRPGPPGPPAQADRLQPNRPMSPGAFNRAPRPLSPGPRPQPKRSMSPGPYGASGPKPMGDVTQRRRSNSASALNVRDRQNSPPGPSKLGPNGPMFRSESPGIAY